MFHETSRLMRAGLGLVLVLWGCSAEERAGLEPTAEVADIEALARRAASEGTAVWYDSSPEDGGRAVVRAFNERYPSASMRHVRLVGGLDIAARMVLEARSPTDASDVATLASEQAHGLQRRGILGQIPWARYGVPEPLIAAPFAVATAAAVYVVLYNTRQLSPETAPRSWAGLIEPRWKGRIGTWVSAHPLVQVVPAWGPDRAIQYAKAFSAQEPVLYRSTFPLAQAVASGELAAGLGILHSAKPLIDAGAHLGVLPLTPTPVSTLYSVIAKASPHPYTARLFVSWLASEEGALAYEAATGRGNPSIAGTDTARFLAGLETSEFDFTEVAEAARWMTRFGARLRAGGRELN